MSFFQKTSTIILSVVVILNALKDLANYNDSLDIPSSYFTDTTEHSTTVVKSHNIFQNIRSGYRIRDYELSEQLYVMGSQTSYLSIDGILSNNVLLSLPSPSQLSASSIETPSAKLPIITNNESDINHSSGNLQLQSLYEYRLTDNHSCIGNGTFYMKDNIFRGGHGEVWRAFKVSAEGIVNQSMTYIVKRMNIHHSMLVERIARREIFFGRYLSSKMLSTTELLTYFIDDCNYWLVYRDDGISLHDLVYVRSQSTTTYTLFEPSKLWKKLRTTTEGSDLIKGLIHNLILAVSELHELGILHRDLKPNNILIKSDKIVKLIIGDFSSAVNEECLLQSLYGESGPSTKEETLDYAPPEVILSLDRNEIPYSLEYPESYDIWSIGVIFLELILGTSTVFSVDQRSASLMKRNLLKMNFLHNEKSSNRLERNLNLLSALADYCIFDPYRDEYIFHQSRCVFDDCDLEHHSLYSEHMFLREFHNVNEFTDRFSSKRANHDRSEDSFLIQQSHERSSVCESNQFQRALLKRDPLGLGFNDRWGLDLLHRFLQFDPANRLKLDTALKHAYFQGPYRSLIDGSEHALPEDLYHHDLALHEASMEDSVDTDAESLRIETDIVYNYIDAPNTMESDFSTIGLNHLLQLTAAKVPSVLDTVTDAAKKAHATITLRDDPVSKMVFTCPVCGRIFRGSSQSCYSHLKIRDHGIFCNYNKSELPDCLSYNSLLPIDPHSGWCDLQGRRKYVEDFHSIAFTENYRYFGVFDGHFGNRAARYASHRIHKIYEELSTLSTHRQLSSIGKSVDEYIAKQELILNKISGKRWSELVTVCPHNESIFESIDVVSGKLIQHSSIDIQNAIIESYISVDSELESTEFHGDSSGTTASVVVMYSNHIVVGNTGDSRVILCCDSRGDAIQLTVDHTPYDETESMNVVSKGGTITGNASSGHILRVNGRLAVTRSIGDASFGSVVSPVPDVLVLTLNRSQFPPISVNENNPCNRYREFAKVHFREKVKPGLQLFMVVASDGLWDVMSNNEVAKFVCSNLIDQLNESLAIESSSNQYATLPPPNSLHQVAKLLAHEAYVRGSSDNIGVATVDMLF